MHIFEIEYFSEYSNGYRCEYYKDFDKASIRYKELLEKVEESGYMPTISNVYLNV